MCTGWAVEFYRNIIKTELFDIYSVEWQLWHLYESLTVKCFFLVIVTYGTMMIEIIVT